MEPELRDDEPMDINEKAAEIAEIVERDRQRRKRTLSVLFMLLLITTGLAGVVLVFGRSDRQIIRETVSQQVPEIVTNRLNERAPLIITEEVNKQLSSPAVAQRLKPIVDQAVSTELNAGIAPRIGSLEERVASISNETSPTPPGSEFTVAEVSRIKTAISQDLPKQATILERLSGQLEELAAVSNAARKESWLKDKPEFNARLASLQQSIEEDKAKFETLATKVDLILQKLDLVNDPCASITAAFGAFRTYSVKENSKSRLYDLQIQLKVKNVQNGFVRGLIIYNDSKSIFGPEDVPMGAMVTFGDEKFSYALIPIFINRRTLAKDFVGFAISRTVKCPAKTQ